MIKDRNLKIQLIEYYVRRFWYPHLEVNVLSQNQISRAPKLVTDIDALALAPGMTGRFQTILGDCKTLKGQSPITRALWMKGLIEYFDADQGIIILTKEVEKEHQLTSNTFDVQLFSAPDFDLYARTTADYVSDIKSALAEIENWDLFLEIDKRFPPLKPLAEFSRTGFWNVKNSSYQLRSGLFSLRAAKAELNPANNLHCSILFHHYSLLAIALNQIIIQLFPRYISLKSKSDLSDDLKVILYNGIENYQFVNDLRKRLSSAAFTSSDLSLPEWDVFVELIRLAFERPLDFNILPLYLKEISFNYLSGTPASYNYGNVLKAKDSYLTSFALRFSEYLNRAAGLPPEFLEVFSKAVVFDSFV